MASVIQYPARRQKPAEGMYKYRSARGVEAIENTATRAEGPSVINVHIMENAVTFSLLITDNRLNTHKAARKTTEETM